MAIMRARTLITACAAAALTAGLAVPAAAGTGHGYRHAGAVSGRAASSAAAGVACGYRMVKTITGPGIPPASLPGGQWATDINYVTRHHGHARLYLLADEDGRRIVKVSAAAGKVLGFIGAGKFTGCQQCRKSNFANSGPQGLVPEDGTLWAGNGNGHLLGFRIRSGRQVADIFLGGDGTRADEGAWDGQALLWTVPDTRHPFLALVDPATRQVMRRIRVPGAQSYEQPAWDFRTGDWYVSVPSTATRPGGEVAVLSPSGNLLHVYPAGDCTPGGLAVNHRAGVIGLGCATTAAMLMTVHGRIIERIPPVKGVDEVWWTGARWLFGQYLPPAGCQVVRQYRYAGEIPAVGNGFHACAGFDRMAFLPGTGGIKVWRR